MLRRVFPAAAAAVSGPLCCAALRRCTGPSRGDAPPSSLRFRPIDFDLTQRMLPNGGMPSPYGTPGAPVVSEEATVLFYSPAAALRKKKPKKSKRLDARSLASTGATGQEGSPAMALGFEQPSDVSLPKEAPATVVAPEAAGSAPQKAAEPGAGVECACGQCDVPQEKSM